MNNSDSTLDLKSLVNTKKVLEDYLNNNDNPEPRTIEKMYREFPNLELIITKQIYHKISPEICKILIKYNWTANNLIEVLSYYDLRVEIVNELLDHLEEFTHFVPTLFMNLESLSVLLENSIIRVNDDLMHNIISKVIIHDPSFGNSLYKLLYKHHLDFKKWALNEHKVIKKLCKEIMDEHGNKYTVDDILNVL